MADYIIERQGNAEVTVPVSQSIAISNYGGGIASIYYWIVTANIPSAWKLQQTLNNGGVTLGPFTTAQDIRIEAGNSKVIYEIGTSPGTGIGNADLLNGLPSDTADTASTIAARDSSGDIAANAFESTVATGTAPLTVASTTKVANLNADLLDDMNSATASTATTIAARDASGNLTSNVLISDVATGTAPLTVASTTAVTNLNADQTDGYNAAEAATVSTLAARNASGDIAANAFESTVATGTAPLTVASTTVVTNLNAERLSGIGAAQFLRSDTEDTIDAGNNGSPLNIQRSSQTAEEISIAFITDGAWTRYFGMDNGVPKWGTSDVLSSTGIEIESVNPQQGTPTAETTSTTLTAADIAAKIITVNNGAAGTTTLTLPLATAMDSGFPAVQSGRSVDFYVINISTVAAEDADIATNTGWTLVGDMNIEANDAARARSSAKFRARKTGTGAWTLYRLS